MSREEVRKFLQAECKKAGGPAGWASKHAVSLAYVCDVVAGARKPGPKILRALGLAKHEVYK